MSESKFLEWQRYSARVETGLGARIFSYRGQGDEYFFTLCKGDKITLVRYFFEGDWWCVFDSAESLAGLAALVSAATETFYEGADDIDELRARKHG